MYMCVNALQVSADLSSKTAASKAHLARADQMSRPGSAYVIQPQMLSHEQHHVSVHGPLWVSSGIHSNSLTHAELLCCTVLW